jgi:hypothetical protein
MIPAESRPFLRKLVRCYGDRKLRPELVRTDDGRQLQVEYQPERTNLPYQVLDQGEIVSFCKTEVEAEARLDEIAMRRWA